MCFSLALGFSASEFPLSDVPRPFQARHVVASQCGVLRRDEHLFVVTTTACDCASPLLKPTAKWELSAAVKKKVRGLRARGWKEPRIERWLAEQRRLVEVSGADHPAGEGEHPSLPDWEGLLRALFTHRPTAGGVALMVLKQDPAGSLVCLASSRVAVPLSRLAEKLPLLPDYVFDIADSSVV